MARGCHLSHHTNAVGPESHYHQLSGKSFASRKKAVGLPESVHLGKTVESVGQIRDAYPAGGCWNLNSCHCRVLWENKSKWVLVRLLLLTATPWEVDTLGAKESLVRKRMKVRLIPIHCHPPALTMNVGKRFTCWTTWEENFCRSLDHLSESKICHARQVTGKCRACTHSYAWGHGVVPPSVVLPSMVSVTCSQPWSANIKFSQPSTASARHSQLLTSSWLDDPGSPEADDPPDMSLEGQ